MKTHIIHSKVITFQTS